MDGPSTPSPLRRIAHAVCVAVGALGFALLCFLVLPLLQAISAVRDADLELTSVDTTALPPPPPPEVEEQQKEPETQESPPPALADETPPLDLSQLELALNPGMAGLEGAGDFAVRIAGVGAGTDKGTDELFSLGDLDQKPRAIFQQQPTLTAALRKKVPATVHVVFTVDQAGRVENPVVQSASDPAFEAPVLAAIKQWKFEPGRRGGQPVRFRMRQPMSFQ